MKSPKRMPWESELDGSLSPDWVVGLIVAAILLAGAFGFWFNQMYATRTGIFGP